ncbi:ribonuclease H-like domain-containing protein [Tanacetum coccineum]
MGLLMKMATLIPLIKDNKIGKNVQANMTGFESELGHPAKPVLNVLKESLQFDNKDQNVYYEICQRAKQTREPFPLNDHTSKFLSDLVHLDLWGPYKYPKMPNDDERVDPNLNSDNKSQSDSSHSSVSGRDVNTADFPDNSGNDVDHSKDIFATQNEKVTTFEDNIFSEGNLDQYPNLSTQGVQNVRRSSRQSVLPRNYNDFVVESKVKYEMDALLRNDTWEIVNLPKDRKAIGSKRIYKIKYRSNGEIDIYTARLVAQGFGQKKGLIIRRLFLLLKKCLYGLKQAPRQWNAKFTSTLIENGFSQSKSDYSFYTKSDKGIFLALLVYVDDIIITSYNIFEIEKFKVISTDKDICHNQRKYILDLLSEYGLGVHIIKDSGMNLKVFSDADWAKCVVTRKSITGYCVFLNNSLISWKSKKQNALSESSTKAEYRALASVTSEGATQQENKTTSWLGGLQSRCIVVRARLGDR